MTPDDAGRHTALIDRLVLTALHTPVLHSALDHGLCQLRYRGRLTGRTVTLPAQYARHGADVVIALRHLFDADGDGSS